MDIMGKPFPVIDCPECEKEEEEKEKNKELYEQQEKERIAFEKENKGIPKKFIGARLSQFENIEPIIEWANKPNGFLFIYGQCGTGKTHLAAALKHHFNKIEKECDFVFSSDLFLTIRNTFNNKDENSSELKIIKKYAPDVSHVTTLWGSGAHIKSEATNLCIFDDIGAQKISDYVIEAWYNIIDRRYMHEHPTVFTSNLSLREISAFMTDRIASRLASGIVFELKGEDKRLKKICKKS